MHLIHKSLIPILPKKAIKDLVWYVSLIADEIVYINENEDEMHEDSVRVNSFPIEHFIAYCRLVIARAIELDAEFKLDVDTIAFIHSTTNVIVEPADIFGGWMDLYYFVDSYNFIRREYGELVGCEQVWYSIC